MSNFIIICINKSLFCSTVDSCKTITVPVGHTFFIWSLNNIIYCMFLKEKKVSEEKLNDLETKIKEYSEMLEENKCSNRLPPIDENAELEAQVKFFF